MWNFRCIYPHKFFLSTDTELSSIQSVKIFILQEKFMNPNKQIYRRIDSNLKIKMQKTEVENELRSIAYSVWINYTTLCQIQLSCFGSRRKARYPIQYCSKNAFVNKDKIQIQLVTNNRCKTNLFKMAKLTCL